MPPPDRPLFVFTFLFVVSLALYFLGALHGLASTHPQSPQIVVGALGLVASLEILFKHLR